MKAKELREQTEAELRELLREQTQAMVEFRAKRGVGDTSEQPLKMRFMRKDIARIGTIMRERGLS